MSILERYNTYSYNRSYYRRDTLFILKFFFNELIVQDRTYMHIYDSTIKVIFRNSQQQLTHNIFKVLFLEE